MRVEGLAALLEKDALALAETPRSRNDASNQERFEEVAMTPRKSLAEPNQSVTEEADSAPVPAEKWLHNYVDEYGTVPQVEHLVKFARHRGSNLSYAAARRIIQRTQMPEADGSFNALDSAVRKLEEMPRIAPVPLAAPSGLRGFFKSANAYEDYEPMDLENLVGGSVLLNVYDAGDEELVQKMNRWGTVNDNVLLGGIFHVGVQIFDEEWSFGEIEVDGIRLSGIYTCRPRCNWKHKYKCTIDLGLTELDEDEVALLAMSMKCSNTWQGVEYDEVHHNCLHFANVFCSDLGVGSLPGWLDRFGRARVQVENLKDRARQVAKDIGTESQKKFESVKERVRTTSAAEVKASLSRWGTGLLGFGNKVIEAFKTEDSEDENDEKKDIFGVGAKSQHVVAKKVAESEVVAQDHNDCISPSIEEKIIEGPPCKAIDNSPIDLIPEPEPEEEAAPEESLPEDNQKATQKPRCMSLRAMEERLNQVVSVSDSEDEVF